MGSVENLLAVGVLVLEEQPVEVPGVEALALHIQVAQLASHETQFGVSGQRLLQTIDPVVEVFVPSGELVEVLVLVHLSAEVPDFLRVLQKLLICAARSVLIHDLLEIVFQDSGSLMIVPLLRNYLLHSQFLTVVFDAVPQLLSLDLQGRREVFVDVRQGSFNDIKTNIGKFLKMHVRLAEAFLQCFVNGSKIVSKILPKILRQVSNLTRYSLDAAANGVEFRCHVCRKRLQFIRN